MARRRFFVNEIRGGAAAITGDDAAHLTRVLRVEEGQRYEISDNENVWLAEVKAARKSLVEFAVIEPVAAMPPAPAVHLYAALYKFDRFEWMIEKVTELGVARVIPVETERSEHGLFQAAERRVERWRRIAREASQQSRRARLPEIAAAIRLRDLPAEGVRLLLDESLNAPALRVAADWKPPISLLIGPEGGWTEQERDGLVGAGWRAVSLGPFVLRAETAGMAAMAVIMAGLTPGPASTPTINWNQ